MAYTTNTIIQRARPALPKQASQRAQAALINARRTRDQHLGDIDWNALLTTGLNTFSTVATTALQSNAQIQQAKTAAAAASSNPFASLFGRGSTPALPTGSGGLPVNLPSAGMSTTTMLLIGGGVLAVMMFMMMSKRGN